MMNTFTERRRSGRPKFYDNSKRRIGRQALRNRLNFINDLGFDWINGMSDTALRINLKKEFGMRIAKLITLISDIFFDNEINLIINSSLLSKMLYFILYYM